MNLINLHRFLHYQNRLYHIFCFLFFQSFINVFIPRIYFASLEFRIFKFLAASNICLFFFNNLLRQCCIAKILFLFIDFVLFIFFFACFIRIYLSIFLKTNYFFYVYIRVSFSFNGLNSIEIENKNDHVYPLVLLFNNLFFFFK